MRGTAEARKALALLFREHFDSIVAAVLAKMTRAGQSSYASLPVDLIKARVAEGTHALIADVEDEAEGPNRFGQMLAAAAEIRVSQGFSIEDMLYVVQISQESLRDLLVREIKDPDVRFDALEWCYGLLATTRSMLYTSYVRAHEAVLREQFAIVRQLSTPIMPVYEGVLVLPLVGPVDARRAAQITEALLAAIVKDRAGVVIIDITGVPAIDEGIAGWLTQAVRAARLLGSQVVVVGIGPAIAQTMVASGVDLGSAPTLADLKAGLEYALAQRGLFIRGGEA